MIKKLAEKLHIKDNAGSTMVEVLAGFTILVIVLVECSVHLLGTAGKMIMEAKDMANDRQTLNMEMYQTDAAYESEDEPDFPVTVTLTLDTDKTQTGNLAVTVTISMDAAVERFYDENSELAIVHIVRRNQTP